MDLSKVSTPTLEMLASGKPLDYSKLPDADLEALAAPNPQENGTHSNPPSYPVGQAPWEVQKKEDLPSYPVGQAPWEIQNKPPTQAPAMSDVQNYVNQNLAKYQAANASAPLDNSKGQVAGPTQAKSFLDALKAGYQISTLGLSLRGEMPSLIMPEHAPLARAIAYHAAETISDLPAMLIGGIGGAALFGSEGATVGSVVPGVGTAIGGVGLGTVGAYAGSNAFPAALRRILMDHYEKGDIKTGGEFLARAFGATWAALRGATIGGAAALTGGAAEALAPEALSAGAQAAEKLAPPALEGMATKAASAFTPVATSIAKSTSELATMTTVGSALHGHLPNADDFVNGAIMLAGMHAVTGGLDLATKFRNVYANTGEHPYEIVAEANKNPVLKQQLLSEDPNLPSQATRTVVSPEGELVNPNFQAEVDAAKEAQNPTIATNRTDAENEILSQIVDHPETKSNGITLDRVRQLVTDDLNPLKVLVNAQGKDLPASQDPYLLARNMRAWAGNAQRALEYNTTDFNSGRANGEGLMPILNDVPNHDLNGLTAFLVANRALEKSQQGIETGTNLDAAKQVVDAGQSKFGPIAQRLTDFQNRIKQYATDAGLLSPEDSAAMEEANKNYIPFQRLLDEDPLTGSALNLSKGSSSFQAMTGSERDILNPLHSVFKNTIGVIKASEQNRVMQALTDLPEKEGFMEQATGETPTKNQFAVYRNGVRESWRFNPDVADAIRAMDYNPDNTNLFIKMFKPFATALRLGTVLNPGFLIRHFGRSEIVDAIQSNYPHVPFLGPLAGIGDIFSKGSSYQEFLSSGGANSAFSHVKALLDSKPWELNKETGMLDHVWNTVKSAKDAVRAMSEIADNATRIAEFKRAGGVDGDLDQKLAAGYKSREITMDYTRAGSAIRTISPAIPFLNAGMQGGLRTIDTFMNSPVKATALSAAAITIPTLINYAMHAKDPRYQDAPQWEKDNFWVIPTDHWRPATSAGDAASYPPYLRRTLPNGTVEVNDGVTYRVPKPFEYGLLFGSLPEHVLDAYFQHKPGDFKDFAGTVVHGLAPNMIPTLLTPILEQATNHSFFTGNQIVSSRNERVLPQYQYTDYTSEVAKQLGRLIGYTPLGDFGSKDAKLSSPEVIDNYIRDWSGTTGAYAVNFADRALHAAGIGNTTPKPVDTLSDIPFVKEFVVRNAAANLQPIQDFYNSYSQSQQEIQSYRELAKEGDYAAAKNLIQMHPELELNLTQVAHALSFQNAFIQHVYDNPTMTPTDKRQLINTAYWQMNEVAKRGNQMIEQFQEMRKQNH